MLYIPPVVPLRPKEKPAKAFKMKGNGWIRVKDRLPGKYSGRYLVVVHSRSIFVASMVDDWLVFGLEKKSWRFITHWQPLPELPDVP